MSKTDQMRAMREARFAARVSQPATKAYAPARPAPSPASERATPPSTSPVTETVLEPVLVAESVASQPSETVPAPVSPVEAVAEAAPVVNESVPVASATVEMGALPTGARPDVPAGRAAHLYKPRELQEIATWLASDGKARTMDDYITDMMADLQFVRRGKKIIEAFTSAVTDAGAPVQP